MFVTNVLCEHGGEIIDQSGSETHRAHLMVSPLSVSFIAGNGCQCSEEGMGRLKPALLEE